MILQRFQWPLALSLLLSLHSVTCTSSSTTTASNTLPRSNSIPRSHDRHRRRIVEQTPPWNPSNHIDDDGFLSNVYQRIPGEWESEVRSLRALRESDCQAIIRQVPGDGNCLFHSISLCLYHAVNGTHRNLTETMDQLYSQSQQLRTQAVQCLRQSQRRLFLQGRETLKANELVTAAAQQYGLTAQEYCASMEQECVWGGGPEIVALCNLLQRPIHVYELAVVPQQPSTTTDSNSQIQQFCLRRMACFGSPRFDRKRALHILSADSRFPDLQPGNQLAAGNHFLAVFPHKIKRRRLRGGGEVDTNNNMNIRSRWPKPQEERGPLKRANKVSTKETSSREEPSTATWGGWCKSVLHRLV